MICIGPFELSKLSISDLGFSSADAFLDLVLFIANKEIPSVQNISLNKVLDKLPYEQVKNLIVEDSKISELTPVLYSLKELKEVDIKIV